VRKLDYLAATLVLIGGLNWGLVAVAKFDLVAWIFGMEFGETNAASRIVYGLVGLAAVYGIGALVARGRRVAQPAAAGLAAILAVVALAVPFAATAATARPATGKNIVQTAVAAGKFKTLTKLLKTAGLTGTLAKPGPFTVFAPTDAAFAKVPKKTLTSLLKNKAKLRAVLLYHVVAGKVTSDQVVKLSSAKTLNGKSVRIKVSGSSVFVNNAKVTRADVAASNGVIHVVNRVLIPR
jgi:uncharacterized surface protein with fasciclin (FAS1) repeats/uncharacterized membrane protein YuzA (DUF378 family)